MQPAVAISSTQFIRRTTNQHKEVPINHMFKHYLQALEKNNSFLLKGTRLESKSISNHSPTVYPGGEMFTSS